MLLIVAVTLAAQAPHFADEWGGKAVDRPTGNYDIHATVLHLLSIDHERLTFRHNGIDRRLTDVHGKVLTELLA